MILIMSASCQWKMDAPFGCLTISASILVILPLFSDATYPVSDVDGKQFGRLNRIKGNLRDLAESGDGASVSEDRPERVECALPCEQDVTRKESGCLDVGG